MKKTTIAIVVVSVWLGAFAEGQVATNPPAGRPAAPRAFQALSVSKILVLGIVFV
jgi:hypothetical protein